MYIESESPNLPLRQGRETFIPDETQAITIGSAYSADKQYRLARGRKRRSGEEPGVTVRADAERQIAARGHRIDLALPHTCPLKYEPKEVFSCGIGQSAVAKRTENRLDGMEGHAQYRKWYCGHCQTNKRIHSAEFLFEDIKALDAAAPSD